MPLPALGSPPLDLKARIDAIRVKARGPVAIACHDPLTGVTWATSPERAFPAGQLAALPLLSQVYDLADRDEIDLEALRPLLIRTVTQCDGEAIAQLAERLWTTPAETVTAKDLLATLAALEPGHPLWDLLTWEGDRTKFPRRLPRVPIAYKAADRCDPQLAHGAGRIGGPEGVLLVILTEEDPAANSIIGRIAKAVWDFHLDQVDRQHDLQARLDAQMAHALPDRRLGLFEVKATWTDGLLSVKGETTLPRAVWDDWQTAVDIRTLVGEPAVVVAPVLNLRREPRHGAELVSQAPMGTRLAVLQRPEGEWWRVQTPDGYVAWGRCDNLRLEPLAPEGLRTLPAVLMAERPDGMGAHPIAAGSELRIRERRPEGWLAVTPAGIEVWVPENAGVAPTNRQKLWRHPETLGARAAAIAQSWLGVPYLWGGKSGWGLDCSGLTQLAYELLGVRLPRDADQQAKALPALSSWDELTPGDLLFYPGHVAMWAGGGAVIHASSPRGGVVREEVSRVPWLRERCSGMGRVVGAL